MYSLDDIMTPIIMHCKAPKEIDFKSELGFNHFDLIMTKEQSVLTKTMKVFAVEKIMPQYSTFAYTIHLYFLGHKLAIEIDENGHKSRNIDYEIKRRKGAEQELGCKFIRINPDQKNFDMNINIGKIYSHIKKPN